MRPGEDVELAFAHSLADRAERRRIYASLRDQPAVTLDGMRIGLHLNAAFLIDLAALETTAADGIGLYRTELAFMVSDRFPDVETQMRAVRQGARAGRRASRWCSARSTSAATSTCPTGGCRHEDNPAMGWRAMRMVLDRPAILRAQLRALIRSAARRAAAT